MPPVEIKPDIYWIGVNDRTTDLFEGIWPISQEGVSYNAYLIDDEKKAIIDLAKAFKGDAFLEQVDELIDVRELDYVVMNHLEPDHSGLLSIIRRIAPDVTLICSKKASDMLATFFQVTENVQVVGDGEELSLGKHTLRFFSTPMVHWPETMMTYVVQDEILFACDAFGSYGALRGAIFDDECIDHQFYEQQALRYYVNIVALFSNAVLRAIAKLDGLPISVIAPSHGLVWRDDPGRIVTLYKKWAEYARGPGEVGVTLLYASMYGNTEMMMNAVARGISDQDVPVEIYDVTRTHASYILPSLWTQRGVLVGAPTYEGGLFPLMAHTLDMAGQKKIRDRKVAYFGSFGWSGGARREVEQIADGLTWEMVDTFEFCGIPTEEDLRTGRLFGARFAESLKQ